METWKVPKIEQLTKKNTGRTVDLKQFKYLESNYALQSKIKIQGTHMVQKKKIETWEVPKIEQLTKNNTGRTVDLKKFKYLELNYALQSKIKIQGTHMVQKRKCGELKSSQNWATDKN